MKANIGTLDKAIRIVAGLGVVVCGVVVESIIVGLIGIAILVSAYLTFCPIYRLCKISTKKHDDNSSCCGGSSCGCH